MSELKAIQGVINGQQFELYFKSEADKVIAELKDNLGTVNQIVKASRELLLESQKMHKRCADNAVKIIRHHKYKRCLAMAKACHEKSERMYCEASTAKSLNKIIGKEPNDAVVEKFKLWGAIACTHCKRWLALAEKFNDSEH